jgi:hypothetical protein
MTIFGRTFTDADLRRVIWTAVQAAVIAWPALLVGVKGGNLKASVLAFVITVGSAALSALKNWFLADGSDLK